MFFACFALLPACEGSEAQKLEFAGIVAAFSQHHLCAAVDRSDSG